jgi:integrase
LPPNWLCQGASSSSFPNTAAPGAKPAPKSTSSPRRRSLARAKNLRPTTDSLRGLHATLAIEEGASGEAVARALGHTSFEITAKHYASPDSVANARLEKVGQSLAPERLAAPASRIDQLLSSLTPEELAALRKHLSV